MKYIASVYEPGVSVEYFSMDMAVEDLDNLSKAELKAYDDSFNHMLGWLEPYIPERVELHYKRYSDFYKTKAEYLAEVAFAKKKYLAENSSRLPEMTPAKIAATEMNVRLLPGQDEDPLWREKNELLHRNSMGTKTMRAYRTAPELIQTCPIAYDGILGTGSTKRSYAKFWVGAGALEQKGDDFNQLVLTPKQLENGSFEWEDVHIPDLRGKNFNKIRITK